MVKQCISYESDRVEVGYLLAEKLGSIAYDCIVPNPVCKICQYWKDLGDTEMKWYGYSSQTRWSKGKPAMKINENIWDFVISLLEKPQINPIAFLGKGILGHHLQSSWSPQGCIGYTLQVGTYL